MLDSVFKRVNTIGQRERQGRDFRFLNRRKEPYEWTDTVPEDDPDFQGLLEEPAPYLDLSSDLPGVALEDEEVDLQVMTDEPKPDFAELAAAALNNAGINADECIQAAQRDANERIQAAQCANLDPGPTLIEANNNEIVYEITFNMPDDGLIMDNVAPADNTIPANDAVHDLAHATIDILTDTDNASRRYPPQLCRSVTRYTLRTTFLQLGEVQAHRSVVDAMRFTRAIENACYYMDGDDHDAR